MKKIKKITVGNDYDSRLVTHNNDVYSCGFDIRIEDTKGRVVFFRLRKNEVVLVSQINPPAEMKNERTVGWEELPVDVKEEYFFYLYPKAGWRKRNLFVYGEKKGREINDEIEWAEAHMIYDLNTTLKVIKKIGRFSEVKFLKTVSRTLGNGYRNFLFLVDGKYQVTVYTGLGYPQVDVEDYAKILDEKKEFGRRASKRAKKAGIPWEIAVFAGNIASDEEAVQVLKNIKTASHVKDERILWELTKGGIDRRTAAIKKVLGDNVWSQLKCRGQKQTKTLASYLAGEA